MNICVGGELDGQVIKKEGRLLNASDIDPSYTSTYYLQIYNRDNVFYNFWHPHGVDLHDLTNKVLEILRTSKS